MPRKKLLTEITEKFITKDLNNQYGFEPKKINRFIVEFPDEFNGLNGYCVCSVNKPVWTLNKGWGEIKFKLYDFIAPSSSQTIFEIINRYKNLDNKNLEFIVKILDPCGIEIENWKIIGEMTIVDFGNLDYTNDELSYINFIVEPEIIDLN